MNTTLTNVTSTNAIAKIPYNNGYGDFCFGRMLDLPRVQRDKMRKWWPNAVRTARMKSNKPQGSRSREFERSGRSSLTVTWSTQLITDRQGSFRYTDLPEEIKQHIIRLLLKPLLSYHPDFKTDMFKCDIHQSQYFGKVVQLPDHLAGDLQDFIIWKNGWSGETRGRLRRENLSEEALATYEAERVEMKKTFYQIRNTVPGRGPYLLDPRAAPIERSGPNGQRGEPDYHFLDWVRQAATTSSMFRQDMANIIWGCVAIRSWGHISIRNLKPLISFLEERPAAHIGIREIDLELRMDKSILQAIPKLCLLLSNLSRLRTLTIRISISKENLKTLAQDTESVAVTFGAFRTIKYVEVFNLSTTFPMWLLGLSLEERAREQLLIDEQLRVIRGGMMPDHLRVQASTEMSLYLNRRLKELNTVHSGE
jgi:hypothetical protein